MRSKSLSCLISLNSILFIFVLTLETSRGDSFQLTVWQVPVVHLASAVNQSESGTLSVLAENGAADFGEPALFWRRELEQFTGAGTEHVFHCFAPCGV